MTVCDTVFSLHLTVVKATPLPPASAFPTTPNRESRAADARRSTPFPGDRFAGRFWQRTPGSGQSARRHRRPQSFPVNPPHQLSARRVRPSRGSSHLTRVKPPATGAAPTTGDGGTRRSERSGDAAHARRRPPVLSFPASETFFSKSWRCGPWGKGRGRRARGGRSRLTGGGHRTGTLPSTTFP